LMAVQSSVSSSRVSAFRRSGRLRVTTLICGDSFSIRTTGMGIVTSLRRQTDKRLRLDDSGVEMRFRRWTRHVVQQANQHVTRFMRLNDSVHPAAGGAVTHVGLLFVTLFLLRTHFLQFLLRRFLVPSLIGSVECRE